MRYRIEIEGITPIIFNNLAANLDTGSAANQEKKAIAAKKGSNRTEADELRLRELETQNSLYFNDAGEITVPEGSIRTATESAAKKTKQGPQVRQGLLVEAIDELRYDREKYGTTIEELVKTTQFTVPVRVQQSRVLRTRARIEDWSIVFTVDTDPEHVDKTNLLSWLDIAGRKIGLCDWRPEKSGTHGRFKVVAIDELGD